MCVNKLGNGGLHLGFRLINSSCQKHCIKEKLLQMTKYGIDDTHNQI